MKNLSTKFLV